ncbi:MAG: hypothetical protein PVJ43_08385 [Gemmatimonadales bacterium]
MEIHKADRRARRHAVIVVIVACVVGAAILHALGNSAESLRAWIEHDVERAGRTLFVLMALGFSAPMLGLALWIGRFAGEIKRAGRYPPPEAKLTRDTRIRTGTSATAIARLHYLLAVLAALMAIFVPVVLWRVYAGLFGT